MGAGRVRSCDGGTTVTSGGPTGLKAKPKPMARAVTGVAAKKAPAAPAATTVYTADELKAGEAEIKLLSGFYTVLNSNGKVAYAVKGAGGTTYRAAEYLRDRDAFFGSKTAFDDKVTLCRTELDEDSESLRKKFDPPVKQRTGDWKKAQEVYYAWVRKAYEKERPTETDIGAKIRQGMSKDLAAKLANVDAKYDPKFHTGGFNPRPIKTTTGQRLGTISDHAFGTAVDINDKHNAQIEATDWTALCAIAGVSMDPKSRKATWEGTTPKPLYDHIVAVNAAYVAKIVPALAAQQKIVDDAATALAASIKAGTTPAPTKPAKPKTDAQLKMELIVAAQKADPKLAAISATWISKWPGAFFNLEWELVNLLYAEKLTWGAIFSRVDLHHFQM